MTYEDETVDELRDRLRSRDLPVSGTRGELVSRLEAADREDDGEASTSDSPPRRRLRDVVERLRSEFADVTGLEPEATTGMERTADGWAALIDVVELARIPRSTDVLATYEVQSDEDGSLLSFDRVHRYRRSEAGSS